MVHVFVNMMGYYMGGLYLNAVSISNLMGLYMGGFYLEGLIVWGKGGNPCQKGEGHLCGIELLVNY